MYPKSRLLRHVQAFRKRPLDSPRLKEAMSPLCGEDLVHASVHYRLHRDLHDSVQEYELEFNESNTFWSLTFNAHFEACLFRLCRAYDQNEKSLHLRNWLKIIQENLYLFETGAFKTRLKHNPFVESLVSSAKKPDQVQLRSDIVFASNQNLLVKKLTLLRNNLIAHKRVKLFFRNRDFWLEQSLKYQEIESLLENGIAILNRYSVLFEASSYSTQMVGHDDYRNVLASIRASRERNEAEIEDEIRRIGEGKTAS